MEKKITGVWAREILDSRGNPTLEVTVEAGKLSASAKVPSGASTGKFEALELRDNDRDRYGGKGVLKAIDNVNSRIKPAVLGLAAVRPSEIDLRLIDLDGSANKARLGANAILGVSLASCRLGALVSGLPLYKFIRQAFNLKLKGFSMPVPLTNIVNGGAHADSNLDFQEFWIIPAKIPVLKERIRAISEIFHALGVILKKKGLDTDVGNEGGYAPDFQSLDEVWQVIIEAVSQANYELGREIFLGLDAGASEFFNQGRYEVKMENKAYSATELSELYQSWFARYPFLAIEDPFDQEDWGAWKEFKSQVGRTNPAISIIGDDLFTTNTARLERGIEEDSANAILIKPNQIGTLTETIAAIKLARNSNFKIAVSHRSGETDDDFIADLAVAANSEFIKTGAPSRSERVAKYNRLMAIEAELEER